MTFSLEQLAALVAQRAKADSATSYTKSLLERGLPRIAQKIGEEGVEVAVATLSGDDQALVGEISDLLYHLLVLLEARQIPLDHIWAELQKRMGQSGLDEKKGRNA